MHKRLMLALVCLVALVASACGGGDDSADDPRLDEVVTWVLEGDADDEAFDLSESQARCMAGKMVDGLDDDMLDVVLAGTLSDDPPPGAELVLIESLFDCVDLTQLMIDQMVADGASQEEAECFSGAFSEDTMRALMTSEFTGEDPPPGAEEELMSAVMGAMMTCGGFGE